jgi:acetyl-CoA carboxylase beta subunit
MEEKVISEPKRREFLQQCHACRQHILASEMNKHLKTCLAHKKKPSQAAQQAGEEVDIRSNLDSLSARRPDIFGAQEHKISLREEEAQS